MNNKEEEKIGELRKAAQAVSLATDESVTIIKSLSTFLTLDLSSKLVWAVNRIEKLEAVAREVWDSVPAEYPLDGRETPMIRRHARALTELGKILEEGL